MRPETCLQLQSSKWIPHRDAEDHDHLLATIFLNEKDIYTKKSLRSPPESDIRTDVAERLGLKQG